MEMFLLKDRTVIKGGVLNRFLIYQTFTFHTSSIRTTIVKHLNTNKHLLYELAVSQKSDVHHLFILIL